MQRATVFRRQMSTLRSLAAVLRGRSSAIPHAQPIPLKPLPVYHGKHRQDTYHWLQYAADPAVEKYLHDEQRYVDAFMADTVKFQHELYEDMARHVEREEESVPEIVDAYMYYTRTGHGESLPIYYRQPVDPSGHPVGPEQVVLDQNDLLKRHPYVCVGTVKLSEDHALMAYTIDTTGDETYSAGGNVTTASIPEVIAELRGGEVREVQRIPGVVNVELCGDGTTVLYTAPDDHGRPARVYRQHIGGGEPSLILKDNDPRFYLDVSRTKDKRFITINANSKLTSEVWVLDAQQPWSEPRLVRARESGVEYFVDHSGEHFYIVTNADGATNYKVVKAPDTEPRPSNWVDYYVPGDGTVIQDMDLFQGHCAIYERDSRGLPQVTVLSRHGAAHKLPLASAMCSVQPGANATYTATKIRLTLSGPLSPELTLDYDMDRRTMQTLRRKALDDINPDDYVVQQVLAPSEGADVPITLVHRRGVPLDGSAPLLVHGYGAYGQNLDVDFHAERLALFTRGWVYAMCHVRGGLERGKAWHEDGRLMRKRHSFADWAACIRKLHAARYSSPGMTAARGASAGGLLTASGCMLYPGLVKSAILRVPFVDVLTAMLDETLHLTVHEYDEWGNPRDSREAYDYIASYCPYTLAERVDVGALPHMLAMASMRDTRVPYWQPAKLVARLRERRRDLRGLPELFLSTDWDGGHFGSGGRLEYLRDYAYEYAFLHKSMGLLR